ncbi:hypothetical protein [Bacillus methanolicus]|nr:hypothetical protein [Bacillus methanolicus]
MHQLLSTLQSIPLASASFLQAMGAVLHHLQMASRNLALGCGITSEFRYLPESWGLPELHIVHARYLTPFSYHLYSALGAAELLANGQGRPPHFPLMVGCMNAILRLWQNFPMAITNLRKSVSPTYTATVDQGQYRLYQMASSIQQALSITRSTVNPAIWEASLRASQLAYKVREKVAKSLSEEMY